MDKILLDTDIFSEILKQKHEKVVARAEQYHSYFGFYTITTPLNYSLHAGIGPPFNDTACPAQSPGPVRMVGPPSAQSPFARNRCYLLRCGVLHHLRGHYSTIIAHTGSCARPKPSR